MSLSSPISYWDILEHPHTQTHTHRHTAPQPLPVSVCKLMLKICYFSYTFFSPFSILHFRCSQAFTVKDFLFWFIVSVFHWVLCHTHLSLSFLLSFRFGARSTGSRRGEKHLIFQYVILYFLVNKCVCVHIPLWVCLCNTLVQQTQFSLQLLLLMEKNHYSSNANESWPQSNIAQLLASH